MSEPIRAGLRGHTTMVLAAGVLCVALLGGCGDDTTYSGEQPGTTQAASVRSSAPPSVVSSVAAPPASSPAYPPPYIDHVQWEQTEVGPSLQVYPTRSGRYTQDPSAMDAAWAEVRRLDRTADTPGMRAQFDCHWRFARLVDPEKTSWNLEPRRPVVDEQTMIETRCNPGFAEEPGTG